MRGRPDRGRYRSLFWPGLLILIGLVALLGNLQLIPTDRLYRLGDLWPLLLIVAGLLLLIRRSPMPAPAAGAATALILVLAVAGAGLYVAVGPPEPTGTRQLSVRESAFGIKEATLEIDVGASTLHVQGSSSMVQDLIQGQMTYSGPTPTVTVDRATDRIVIAQKADFALFARPNSLVVDLQLNTAIRWHFVTHSGASTETYDIPNVDVAGMEIDTGASTENISLGFPIGFVPIRINGGALTVHLHRPSQVSASVKVSGGAVSLDFDGDQSSGPGSLSHSTGQAADIFQVSVSGGSCTVTMDAPA